MIKDALGHFLYYVPGHLVSFILVRLNVKNVYNNCHANNNLLPFFFGQNKMFFKVEVLGQIIKRCVLAPQTILYNQTTTKNIQKN